MGGCHGYPFICILPTLTCSLSALPSSILNFSFQQVNCNPSDMIIFVNVTPELGKSKDNSKEIEDATESLKKQLFIEKTLKTQAVNKLAEIMCRKDFLLRENSKKRKATSDDLRKKEKECRKLHQELGAVSWTVGFAAYEIGHF